MRRKILLLSAIFILLAVLVFTIERNNANLQPNDYKVNNETIESQSVVTNTTQTLRANSNGVDVLNEFYNKIIFKYKVLQTLNQEDIYHEEFKNIDSQLKDNKKLIAQNDTLYNSIFDSLNSLNNSINVSLYEYGIEMENDNIPAKELLILKIEDELITCSDGNELYTFDSSKIKNECTFEIGEEYNILYTSIIFEDNIGQISAFYAEKM